jgi:hypothetical protein
MVYGVIQNFIQGLKYRGGWRGLLEHMYTVGNNVALHKYATASVMKCLTFCIFRSQLQNMINVIIFIK